MISRREVSGDTIPIISSHVHSNCAHIVGSYDWVAGKLRLRLRQSANNNNNNNSRFFECQDQVKSSGIKRRRLLFP